MDNMEWDYSMHGYVAQGRPCNTIYIWKDNVIYAAWVGLCYMSWVWRMRDIMAQANEGCICHSNLPYLFYYVTIEILWKFTANYD